MCGGVHSYRVFFTLTLYLTDHIVDIVDSVSVDFVRRRIRMTVIWCPLGLTALPDLCSIRLLLLLKVLPPSLKMPIEGCERHVAILGSRLLQRARFLQLQQL